METTFIILKFLNMSRKFETVEIRAKNSRTNTKMLQLHFFSEKYVKPIFNNCEEPFKATSNRLLQAYHHQLSIDFQLDFS